MFPMQFPVLWPFEANAFYNLFGFDFLIFIIIYYTVHVYCSFNVPNTISNYRFIPIQMIQDIMETKEPSISKLSKMSWIMIANAMLIDTSTWAFPSYNIVIGLLAKMVVLHSGSNSSDHQNEILVIVFFSTTAIISIVFDIVYCFCWGREVRYMDANMT